MLSVPVKTLLAGGTLSSTYKLFRTLTAGEGKHCPLAKIVMTAVSMDIKKPVEPYVDSTMTLSDILMMTAQLYLRSGEATSLRMH